MTRPRYLRLSVVIALAGACLLSGCGRKGVLELPPGRAALEPQPSAPAADNPVPPDIEQQGREQRAGSVAPTGPNRRTPMDWLID